MEVKQIKKLLYPLIWLEKKQRNRHIYSVRKLESKEIGALLEKALQYVTPEQRRARHEKISLTAVYPKKQRIVNSTLL
jgi:hypothetical protein